MRHADSPCSGARLAGLGWMLARLKQNRNALASILVMGTLLVPQLAWSACQQTRGIAVAVSTENAEIAVRTDYSLADLAQLAGKISQNPPHRVLGFYANSIGFRLHAPTPDPDDCGDVLVEVQLVATRRVIELASNIDRCLFDAALRHYRHHAELQARALEQSGSALRSALSQFVADALSSDESLKFGPGTALEKRTRAFVDQWLDSFQKTTPSLQAEGDTAEELEALGSACAV
jgi:hypothetical protein